MSTETSYDIEPTKLTYDLYKQLITLSTGSIVIMITLIDKVFKQPQWRAAIVVSLVAFGLSIVSCTALLVITVIDLARKGTSGQAG